MRIFQKSGRAFGLAVYTELRWPEVRRRGLPLSGPAVRNFAVTVVLSSSLAAAQAVSAFALPDAPEPVAGGAQGPAQRTSPGTSAAVPVKAGTRLGDPKALDPAQPVVPLSAKDKLKLSLTEQLTPPSFAAIFVVAGWEHLRNGTPKYGSDRAGFGERLGAAAVRQSSQAIFSDGVLAAAFHEDPRFYRKGGGSLRQRILYAASRTWRTRTDAGAPTMNYSELLGYGGAAALTKAYYPDVSATAMKTLAGYGWSLLGSILGNQYQEFWPDVAETVFHAPPPATPAAPSPKPPPVPDR